MDVKYIEQEGLMRYNYKSSSGLKETLEELPFNLLVGR